MMVMVGTSGPEGAANHTLCFPFLYSRKSGVADDAADDGVGAGGGGGTALSQRL